MKDIVLYILNPLLKVAPYTGAWIERGQTVLFGTLNIVAPYTGAWIESYDDKRPYKIKGVAPYTGAWIERKLLNEYSTNGTRRSLHGSVD